MSIKKNFIYNFLLTVSNFLFPLLTFPYLSRIIGAEGLGIYNFILSYCENFIIVAALGLPVYGVREIARVGFDKVKLSKLFFELLAIHFLFTTFLLIVYSVSIFLYDDFHNYRQLSLLGGMYILLSVFKIEWLFSGVNDFKYITIRSLIIRALSVISIFIFIKQRKDFNIYFIITVITLFLNIFINVYYARKYISRKINFSLKDILIHIKPVSILGIYMVVTSIYSVLPLTLLGFLSSKAAVGYYYASNKIVRMIISIFTALTTVLIPQLNLIFEKKGTGEYLLLIKKSLNIMICLGIPITFFVFLLSEPLVMVLAGSEFTNSIFCLRIMSPIILIVALAQVFVIMILSIYRRDKEMVILSIIGMVISLIINIIFIPRFAEQATAFSQLIAELLVTIVSYFLAKRFLNFHFPIKLFILNILFVIPFSIFTYLCLKLTDNIFLQLIYSSISCGLYFLFYQFIILKDKFLIGLVEPYIRRLRMTRFKI